MPKHYRPAGKKKEGNAAKYVTRTQAVKLLQVTLPLFRKACILKGVFPREPKKKVKGNHQTYYHTKDIAFIQHDPLLEKFRNIRSHTKKIKKAVSKKNKDKAERLKAQMPSYKIDRLILERYPRFVDALGDLDDCLVTVHLFAALPALNHEKVSVERVRNCRRLSHEWQAYIARAHKLRKTFISVKGIYYQAELEGQKVTWLVPHSLQQVLTDDVDFNVLSTFLEYYEALLTFVNLRLYKSLNVKYPPVLDPRLEVLAAELYALSRHVASTSKSAPMNLVGNQELSDEPLALAQLQHQLSPTGALMHLIEEAEVEEDDDDDETKECKSLFKNMRLFLSREVPREPLLFVITAFGGMVSWEGDGSPLDECDQSITHQVVDRPTQGHKFLSREYVQPQWIFDCVNARIILPTEEYLVGKVPPPHLSPFVDNEAEGYVPDYAQKIKQLQAATKKQVLPVPAVGDNVDDAEDVLLEGVANRLEAQEAVERKQKMLSHQKQYYEEINMELQGVTGKSGATQLSKAAAIEVPSQVQADRNQASNDEGELDTMMMSRKKKGLVKAMKMSNERKQAGIDLLKSRKRKVESGGEKSKKK